MATLVWRGDVVARSQISTLTIGGTWSTSDDITITVGNKAVVITVGANTTTAQVATTVQEAWEQATLTDTSAAVAPAAGSNAYAEMSDITATVDSSVVTFTGPAGRPFTLTTTEDSASGTVTDATSTTATGPNDWSNIENWEGQTAASGAIPVNSDSVIIPNGSSPIYYGLGQSAVTLTKLTLETNAIIGLPEVNTSGTNSYDEYLATHLAIGATDVEINGGRAKLNFGSVQTTVQVNDTNPAADAESHAINLIGTHASNSVSVSKGTVSIAGLAGQSATVSTLSVGYLTNQQSDSVVFAGEGTTLTTLTQTGGTATIDCASTTIDHQGGVLTITDGAHTTLTTRSTCNYNSDGTITTANISGRQAVLNFEQDTRTKTVTNCNLYSGGTLNDPHGKVTYTNGVDLVQCGIPEVKLHVGENITLTPSAI